MSTSLMNHKGARLVLEDDLQNVPTPEGTATWFPVSHHSVLATVKGKLAEAGFSVTRTTLSLSRCDARFFGVLDLASVLAPGVSLGVGIRNSTDKSLPIGFCAGSRVFVCDNLAFRSEVVVARKHTRNGEERYGEALALAVAGLDQFKQTEGARIKRMAEVSADDTLAESIMLRAYDQDIISHRLLPGVIRQWREPRFEEFAPRNLWSLYNAFTDVLRERWRTNAQQCASLTIRLSDLIASHAGLPASEAVAVLSA